MKRLIVYIFALLCTLGVGAQEKDVVTLKSGSVMRGTITEWVANESLTIVMDDGVTAVCPMDKIRSITRGDGTTTRTEDSQQWRPRGYRGFVELGGFVDIGESYGIGCFSTTHGYQFNPKIFLGGGLELLLDREGAFAVPVYVDFRANFTDKRISPYFEGRLGTCFNENRRYFYSRASIGYHFSIKRKFAINVAASCMLLGERTCCVGGTLGVEF